MVEDNNLNANNSRQLNEQIKSTMIVYFFFSSFTDATFARSFLFFQNFVYCCSCSCCYILEKNVFLIYLQALEKNFTYREKKIEDEQK
jgi:hypothetical protein